MIWDESIEAHRFKMAAVHLVAHGYEIRVTEPEENYCPCCRQPAGDVATRRLNTAYVDDELNWLTSCGVCYQAGVEMYAEQWRDYWAGCL